jgi:hypothetical protein
VADYLIQHHQFQKVSFAEPLKRGSQLLFGFSDVELFGNDVQKSSINPFLGVSAREVLQFLGTNIFRENPVFHQGPWTLWISKANEAIETLPDGSKIVVDDVRFSDEVDFVQNVSGSTRVSSPKGSHRVSSPLGSTSTRRVYRVERPGPQMDQKYDFKVTQPPQQCQENVLEAALQEMIPYYKSLGPSVTEPMVKELFRVMNKDIPDHFASRLCWTPDRFEAFCDSRHQLSSTFGSDFQNHASFSTHSSETQQLDVPCVIDNSGDLSQLYENVESLINS